MQLAAKQAQAESLRCQMEACEKAAKADQLAGDDNSAHTLELKLAAAEEDVSLLWVAGLSTIVLELSAGKHAWFRACGV